MVDSGVKLRLLTSKVIILLQRITRLNNIANNLSDRRLVEDFLAESQTIDAMQVKFEALLDEINLIIISKDPLFEPDYDTLVTFDEMYSRVKFARARIIETVKREVQLDMKRKCRIIPAPNTPNMDRNLKNLQEKRGLGVQYLDKILDLKTTVASAASLNSFIDQFTDSLEALNQVGFKDLADFILFHCAYRKIDFATARNFEISHSSALPTTSEFISFLRQQAKLLEYNANNVCANNVSTATLNPKPRTNATVLLPTAQIFVKPIDTENRTPIRCLIDTGSASNCITLNYTRLLDLQVIPLYNCFMRGLGKTSSPILGYVMLDIESRVYQYKYRIHALVVESITGKLPLEFVDQTDVPDMSAIALADLTWNIPADTDLLLGAPMFPYLYLGDKIFVSPHMPFALHTTLGYVLIGSCASRAQNMPFLNYAYSYIAAPSFNDLEGAPQELWEVEEIPFKRFLTPEEIQIEDLNTSTVPRAGEQTKDIVLSSIRAVAHLHPSVDLTFGQDQTLYGSFKQVINYYYKKANLSKARVRGNLANDRFARGLEWDTLKPARPETYTEKSLNDTLFTVPVSKELLARLAMAKAKAGQSVKWSRNSQLLFRDARVSPSNLLGGSSEIRAASDQLPAIASPSTGKQTKRGINYYVILLILFIIFNAACVFDVLSLEGATNSYEKLLTKKFWHDKIG